MVSNPSPSHLAFIITSHLKALFIVVCFIRRRVNPTELVNPTTGLWLKDVASTSPAQHFYTGTDIVSSYYPSPPPPNFTFFNQSMTAPWPSSLFSSFDLVHSRLALPGAGTHPAKLVVQNLIGLVKPGGWIQQTEMVFTEWPNLGPAMKEMVRVCVDVFTIAIGEQELDYLKGLEKWYAEAGLEDVQYETYTIGIGKRAGSEKIRKISVESFESTCRGLVETAKGEFF
jgi:hypothetical protein